LSTPNPPPSAKPPDEQAAVVTPPSRSAGAFGWFGVLLLLAIVAAPLRISGLADDFWLDEIWSWALVWNADGTSRVSGPLGVFTEIHQDNNNHLVTLWLYASGPHAPLWWYRLPSFLAGLATIVVSGMLAARWYPNCQSASAWWTMSLLSITTIFVAYASEGRGYLLAACAGVSAQWWLGRFLERRDTPSAGLFAALSSIGFLSHLTYLTVFVPQAVWCLVAMTKDRRGSHRSPTARGTWSRAALAFGAPVLVVAWLWVVDLSRTQVGGGPLLSPWGTAVEVLALPFGADADGVLRVPAALLSAALLAGGLLLARRAEQSEWVAPAAAMLTAPAILFGLAPAGLVYPRHFLVALALVFPLLGGSLAWLAASPRGRIPVALIALALVAGHALQLAPLLEHGRGQWVSALEVLERESPRGPVLVGGDHDFRNGMLVEFHRARSRGSSRIQYVPQSAWGRALPDWLIVHSLDRAEAFPAELATPGATWTLRRTVPLGGPTGFAWGVYARGPTPAPTR
jgi:hypothetical protein